ncbi:MAG: hypothetical protein OXU77_14015, partial [Gammaproteobacteria bacterium]|nr:hypothetical protein [Gammaproteobacteria bacterium]
MKTGSSATSGPNARPGGTTPSGITRRACAGNFAGILRKLRPRSVRQRFVDQVARRMRAGGPMSGGDDAQSFEGERHIRFLATSCRAMMIRCISLVPSPMH